MPDVISGLWVAVATPLDPSGAVDHVALAKRGAAAAAGLGRHEFYAAAEQAYAVVATGERRRFGNVLLTKGVVSPEAAP